MAERAKWQAGCSNGKYATKDAMGVYGTPKEFKYLTAVQLNTDIGTTEVFADNTRIDNIYSDSGYTGNIGTTSRATDFEIDTLMAMENDGIADINMVAAPDIAFYYEMQEKTGKGTPYTVKKWVFGVQVSKSNTTDQTNTKTPVMVEFSYPLIVNGETLMNEDGTAPYVTENGNEVKVFTLRKILGDDGYETFGDAVPELKKVA